MEIAIALLQHYSFDLGGYTVADLTRAWSKFKPEWVRQAVIESLFRGRYKAVSVSQILQLWDRKGEPNCRYNHEFERLICGDVAVIYEDRIFYTPPRTSIRESSITEVLPSINSEITRSQTMNSHNPPSSLPFPHRSMLGAVKNLQHSQPNSQRYPSRAASPSGTTKSAKNYPADFKANYSETYRSAYANMTLLAESSMFVDKLRSMCSDRLVLPAPAIASEMDRLEVMTEN